MSIRELDYGNVPKMMAEAREMQKNGQYVNGTVFHTLADEIDRLNAAAAELLAVLVEIDKRVIFDAATGFDRAFSDRVDAVIAKAEGRS